MTAVVHISLASMLYGRGYPQTRLHGRLGVVFDAFGGRPRCLIHTARTSPSHRQLPSECLYFILLRTTIQEPIFLWAFASFWTDMDLEFSYVSMLTYFLVIDNADENTMHILQLPKVFGFSFLLKNQGHISLPSLSLSLSLSFSLSFLSFLSQVFFWLYWIFFHSHVCHQSF